MAVLSTVYLLDVLFNLFMVLKSLHYQYEISINDKEIQELQHSQLPIYSILCPLYKEAHMIPQFVQGISQIDWPLDKLDVMLLLEEDDVATIAAAKKMNLPSFVRIVVVPDSQPKTKPKATNYGLAYAKGEYVVIFDAEGRVFISVKRADRHLIPRHFHELIEGIFSSPFNHLVGYHATFAVLSSRCLEVNNIVLKFQNVLHLLDNLASDIQPGM